MYTARSLKWCKERNLRPDLLVMDNNIPPEIVNINGFMARVVSTLLPQSGALADFVEYRMKESEDFLSLAHDCPAEGKGGASSPT